MQDQRIAEAKSKANHKGELRQSKAEAKLKAGKGQHGNARQRLVLICNGKLRQKAEVTAMRCAQAFVTEVLRLVAHAK